MIGGNVDDELNQILKKTQASSTHNLLRDEIACVTAAFVSSTPDAATVRSKAYVVLSAFCQAVRDKKGRTADDATKLIVNTFEPTVSQLLGETNEIALLKAISFLTALFQVDSHAASTIFSQDGVVENLMDTVDLSPSPFLCQEIAHLLGQACGHKICRAIVTPQIVRWLEFNSRQFSDLTLQGAASVALIKLSKGSASDNPEHGTPEVQSSLTDELADRMVNIILSGQTTSSVDAVEGLAYLSADPRIKESLSKNSNFLQRLFSLVPVQKYDTKASDLNPTLAFGVVLIISNLTSFRPRLTEEQKQMEKLKHMTKVKKGIPEAEDRNSPLDDDDHVKARIRSLVASGVLPVFPAALGATDSPGVRLNVGKSLLCIVEERENRGKVLQSGGTKVLQSIINKALSTQPTNGNPKQSLLAAADLEVVQALAKLAITSSPVQVFGPNIGAMYDAIRPFSILLQHPASNLLQRFEAIMALTNLASQSSEVASRIANAEGLMDKVELLLLEEHTLVRRASVELICNLISGADVVFERYSGDSSNSASKIHILLALSDVEDLPTRLASSGALATITSAPTACAALIALQFDKHRFLSVMTQLIDPSALPEDEAPLESDPGLVHRGIVCVHNVLQSITDAQIRERISKEAAESGLLVALIQLVKGQGLVKDKAIVQQAAEIVRVLTNIT